MTARVQTALSLPTKKEAEPVVNTVIASLETTLLNNLGTDGFTLKLTGEPLSIERCWMGEPRTIDGAHAEALFPDRRWGAIEERAP